MGTARTMLHQQANRLAVLHALPLTDLMAEVTFEELLGEMSIFHQTTEQAAWTSAYIGVDLGPELAELYALANSDNPPNSTPEHVRLYRALADKLAPNDAERVAEAKSQDRRPA